MFNQTFMLLHKTHSHDNIKFKTKFLYKYLNKHKLKHIQIYDIKKN